MRKQNIVIFSAGESVRNGRVHYIKKRLNEREIACTNWEELFSTAKDLQNIALLPLLIKKIPTFDFALIIAEGVDETCLRQNEKVKSMRDNVIFELGLCIMALGTERVILFSEKGLRLPDDLIGKGEIGVHHIEFEPYNVDKQLLEVEKIIKERQMFDDDTMEQIADYILSNAHKMSPVYVGASVALAESYFHNFLLRLIKNLDQPIINQKTSQKMNINVNQVSIYIYLPTILQEDIKTRIQEYYENHEFENYYIENAGTRHMLFKAKYEGDHFIIVDIPTSMTASYSVVNAILNLESDDQFDFKAKERFMMKETDMFQYALLKFLQGTQYDAIIKQRFSNVHIKKINI